MAFTWIFVGSISALELALGSSSGLGLGLDWSLGLGSASILGSNSVGEESARRGSLKRSKGRHFGASIDLVHQPVSQIVGYSAIQLTD